MPNIFANIQEQASPKWNFSHDENFADAPSIALIKDDEEFFSIGYNPDTESWFVFHAEDGDDLRGTTHDATSMEDALKILKAKYHLTPDAHSVVQLKQGTANL